MRAPELVHALAVAHGEAMLDLGIVDEDEAPRRGVAGAGRADRGVEDPGLDLGRDRVARDAPHRARGVERLSEVHGCHSFRLDLGKSRCYTVV